MSSLIASLIAPDTGFANPLTTANDLSIGGVSGAPARLAKGTDGQILTVDPATHNLAWANAGKDFDDIIQPVVPLTTAGITTTAALAANTVYLYKFRVSKAFTVANAFCFIAATKAGHIDIGIYTWNSASYDRVWHTGDYDIGTSGSINAMNTIPGAGASTYVLVPNTDYWASFGGTDATLTILRGASLVSAAAGLYKNLSLLKAGIYSSGLPGNITTASIAGATTPFIIGFTT